MYIDTTNYAISSLFILIYTYIVIEWSKPENEEDDVIGQISNLRKRARTDQRVMSAYESNTARKRKHVDQFDDTPNMADVV